MAHNKGNEGTVSFKDSLNLPQTEFPIRSNPKVDDPAMVARWQEEKLYEKSFYHNEGRAKFIFHDGPPYANGNIHLGSAYNKILKDIACKSRRMQGMHVPVTPGWDCHGLPIELKVTQEHPDLSRPELITACRNYAAKWIDIQRSEFKSLGVLMNWDYPYLTMNFSYEAKELKALGYFVEQGFITRSNKTVPWCASCKTVLATAEIEYADRKDPSIYVLFPMTPEGQKDLFPDTAQPISIVAWTTTPWTLALNRAILVKPHTQYVLLDIDGKFVMVGKALADDLCEKMGVEKKVVGEVSAEQLAQIKVQHPFISELVVPIIQDDMVLTNEGTAFVHCAPGAGPQDYETGVKNQLEIFCPVAPDGTYTSDVMPQELAGMPVVDGQIWALKTLAQNGNLLYKANIKHSYPHCWRCRKGLIYRATKQWFFSLTHEKLKERALAATQEIDTLPEKSINRLQATIEGRWEWCLSRQRSWGVPIPALLCQGCDHTYINQEFVNKVAEGVEKEGVEYWQTASIETLVGQNFVCPQCGSTELKKEQDILDVWFDSGLSHYAVLYDNPELGYPADLYLEGKDQHRGWFQSSLLTSVALEGDPSMKTIITHGFTVDEKGVKMSKSLGNTVLPHEIIEQIGTDGLRLWASSIDFSSEAVVSKTILSNVQEVFRKVRNTCRFLLSNLYDFDIEKDGLPIEQMRVIDQYALQELLEFNYAIQKGYEEYDFTNVYHHFGVYNSVNLSSFYLEIVKDTLYVEQADGHARRSVQTACWHILDTMTRLMAPIFSFTAEQVSDLYQKNKTESIHLQNFNNLADIKKFLLQLPSDLKDDWMRVTEMQAGEQLPVTDPTHLARKFDDMPFLEKQQRVWNVLKLMRSAVLKATEDLREKSIIKRSLDAGATVYIDPSAEWSDDITSFFKVLEDKGEDINQFFKEFAIVSQFERAENSQGLTEAAALPGFFVKAEKAKGNKCPRCWQWAQADNPHNLCDRCNAIVSK